VITKLIPNLLFHIHHTVEDVTVKRITVRRDGKQTSLWLTLTSLTNALNSKTVTILRSVRNAVTDFCLQALQIDDDPALSFKITKLDTTLDLAGSFMPSLDDKARILMREKLQDLITKLLRDG